MPLLNSQRYKEIFIFPVINYYKTLGFDFQEESFEDLSVEFINGYQLFSDLIKLTDGVVEVLEMFKKSGIKQVIVSAMRHDMLLQQVKENGLLKYFDAIHGIEHIYADSKVHITEKFISKNHLDPNRILFIGDTLHDWEVAGAVGVKSVLVASGHQSLRKLKTTSATICNNLPDVLSIVK